MIEEEEFSSEEPRKLNSFSMDAILAPEKRHNNHPTVHYKLDSIATLNQPLIDNSNNGRSSSQQDMFVLLFKCQQNQSSRLKLLFHNEDNRLVGKIKSDDPVAELFMMCSIKKTYLVLCSRTTTEMGSFLNTSLYTAKFQLVCQKIQPILDLNRIRPLQLVSSDSGHHNARLYLLVMDLFNWTLGVYVLDLNLNLINALQLAKPFETSKVDFCFLY